MEFKGGSDSTSVAISIDDNEFEETEAFVVMLSSDNTGILINAAQAQLLLIIEDDEVITVSFQNASSSISESGVEVVLPIVIGIPPIKPGVSVEVTFGVQFRGGTASTGGMRLSKIHKVMHVTIGKLRPIVHLTIKQS